MADGGSRMALGKPHEIHTRRSGRNIGVAGLLIGFIVIVFGLTVDKITNGGPDEGYDHAPRPALADRVSE